MAKTHTTATVPAAGRTCQSCSEQGTSSTSLADCREETGRTGAVEDEGETQHHDDKAQDSCVKPQLKSRKSTTEWIDADKRNSSFFLRPSPSRSHLKQLNRTKSAVVSASAPRRNTPVSTSTGLDAAPMPRVSKTEFQNLPSSVQQKYFSELERLRLVQHFGVAHASTPSFNFALPLPIRTAAAPPVSSTQRPRRASQRTSFSAESRASSARRPSIHSSSTESHLYSEKLRRRRPSQDHRKLANRRPHSVAPDKLDEAILKIQAKRLRQHEQLKAMASTENTAGTANRNSFYESFRWLEDDDALDLRLGWDHFTNTLPEGQVAPLQKPDSGLNRRPSFRRHLSINKLSFSRPSATQSRPGTKDTVNAPSFRSQPIPAPAKPSGHIRRKSRALSLISMNKQAATEAPGMIDPSASHYQDPSARNTLRQYTASPQKFDEALEYGFPSLGEVVEKDEKNSGFAPYKLRTFLDDDKSSTYSNDSTVSDPDSPKTPPIVDKALPTQHSRTCTPSESPDLGCASGPNSREMTLRMTLTRPDLRANDEQIYGWKKSAAVRKAHMRGEALAPVQPERQPGVKDMEKHFDALDQENIEPSEKGGMRRFWKRVRRA